MRINSFIFPHLKKIRKLMKNEQDAYQTILDSLKQENNANQIQLKNQIDKNSLVWQKNKMKMLEILKNSPIIGVYKNQNPNEWNNFFKFYVNFLNAQIGPRGQCAKKIRLQMKQNKEFVDQALKPYNLNHTNHIRSIYVRFKFFIPCQQYHLYESTIQTLEKCKQSLERLKQPQHPMYVSIKSGMISKHGAQYPYQQQIAKLQQNYQKKIQKLTEQKMTYMQKLINMIEYQNYTKMNFIMKKWFDQWIVADSGIGKQSCNRGQQFQDRVLSTALPYIILHERSTTFSHIKQNELFTYDNIQQLIKQANQNTNKKNKYNRLHIFVNMRWNPRSLGEIDITVAEYVEDKQRYEALILIQCKARLFDIRQASYQVYPQYLKTSNKVQLSGKYGSVYLSDKATSYIVTALPDFQFSLPIESQLKAVLDRNSKDKPIEDIQQQDMKKVIFQDCIKRFNDELSPLQWLVKNDSNKIIVLSSQI